MKKIAALLSTVLLAFGLAIGAPSSPAHAAAHVPLSCTFWQTIHPSVSGYLDVSPVRDAGFAVTVHLSDGSGADQWYYSISRSSSIKKNGSAVGSFTDTIGPYSSGQDWHVYIHDASYDIECSADASA